MFVTAPLSMMIDATKSLAFVVVTDPPVGVVVAAPLFKRPTTSTGEFVSAPETSMTKAVEHAEVTLKVTVTVVAPLFEFFAYQTSVNWLFVLSVARALGT